MGTDPLNLNAHAAVLLDGDTGRILYGKNEKKVLPMASTTKIMTCILALENSGLDTEVEISDRAASMRISTRPAFINTIRVLCLVVISFGVITNIAGMDLSALWDLSDFANILMVYCNLPLQYIGFRYVLRAWEHFEKNDGTAFTSKIAGIDVPVWDDRAKIK